MQMSLGLGIGVGHAGGGSAPDATLSHASDTSVNFSRVDTDNGNSIEIEWADGTTTTIASQGNASVTYSEATAGTVKLRVVGGGNITRIEQTDGAWDYTLSDLPRNLTYFDCRGSNTISGALSGLPSGLTYFRCQGSNTISGALSDLPAGLDTFICYGSNTVTGDLSELPADLEYFNCHGFNGISGALSGLPADLEYFNCSGNNTVTGDLSELPAGLTVFICYGNNTVSGNLSDLPAGLEYFICTGNNAITGNLSDLPAGLTYFLCNGATNTVTPGASAWSTTMRYCRLGDGLTTGEVDTILINLSAVTTWITEKRIDLQLDDNAPRSSASDSAVTTLQGNGVTVNTA